jgi:hypothetical protein
MIVCMLFYFHIQLPRRDDVLIWDTSKLFTHQIFHYIHKLVDLKSQENSITKLFVVFKSNMNERERIPKKIVENYKDE